MKRVLGRYNMNNLPGPGDFDPPEYPEPYELNDVTEEIELELSGKVIVNEDGSWDYTDTSWAESSESNGVWHSDTYPSVSLGDANDIIEHIDELIEAKVPDEPGLYPIRGTATIVFVLSNIQMLPGKTQYDDDEVFTDDIDVDFDSSSSTENITIQY